MLQVNKFQFVNTSPTFFPHAMWPDLAKWVADLNMGDINSSWICINNIKNGMSHNFLLCYV